MKYIFLIFVTLFTLSTNAQTATEYLTAGNARYELRDYKGAIEKFSNAIKLNPNFSKAYHRRGDAKTASNNAKGAIADYNQSIILDPTFIDAYISRANAKEILEDLPGALEDFNKAISLDPKGPSGAIAYNLRGQLKASKNDQKGAIADFSNAIEFGNNKSGSYYSRGYAKNELQDYKAALADYDLALNELYQGFLISLIGSTAKEEEIAKRFKNMINTYLPNIYINRGITKSLLIDYAGSIEEFDLAIQYSPENADAYYNRANAKGNIEDYKGAIADYTKTTKLSPKSQEPYNEMGSIKYKLKNYAGAIADFTKSITIDPKDGEIFYRRALAKAGLKDYTGAKADLTKAILIDNGDWEAYFERGNIKLVQKDFAGAIEDYNKALVVNPDYEQARTALNETTELKRKAEAPQNVKEPVKKTPPPPEKINLDNDILKNIEDNTKKAIGTIAPDFTQTDVNGKSISLSSFRGKYVFINFWASWSEPSIMENPNIVKAYNTIKKTNFEIISISIDKADQKEKWEKIILVQQLNWTQLCDFKGWNNEVAKLYHVYSVPTNFLLDPDGKIIATNLRGELLSYQLMGLIK